MPGILTLSNDSPKKTIVVAIALCLVCSVVVAGAAVLLKPLQVSNQLLDMRKNILEVADLLAPGKSIDELFQQVETRFIDLETGEYVEHLDPATYDIRSAAKDPELSERIPADQDIASIRRKPKYVPVYLVRDEQGEIDTIILPVHGYGLWSTMYGFIALAPDTKTVKGLKFYEHGETPGLGGEIDNPRWQAQWEGKIVYDEQWNPVIEVVKGTVDPDRPGAEHRADGLAGATLTARGVMNMLRYWLSEQGYGPYLAQIREQTQEQRG